MATSAPWTFITNYGLVLSHIFHNPRTTLKEMADQVGITERTTHKIITALESDGYIEVRKIGRRNVYRVDSDLPLRHHTKQDIRVADLLKTLTSKKVATYLQ